MELNVTSVARMIPLTRINSATRLRRTAASFAENKSCFMKVKLTIAPVRG
jgi:hypothetical protein